LEEVLPFRRIKKAASEDAAFLRAVKNYFAAGAASSTFFSAFLVAFFSSLAIGG
jgi:hypothetical protein